jgi:CheY-like chemotaxis protein
LLPAEIEVQCTATSTRRVFVDPADLQQALLNLAINARDAMPDGGRLDLRVDDSPSSDGRPGVAIQVADTGAGIPPEIKERLFEPFFTTKPPGKGTGLGLTMVRQFADQAGGRVEVQSALDRGSVFTLWLPESRVAGYDPEAAPALLQGTGEMLLLVEDRPEVLNVARRTLERGGYAVESAADGAAAIALMETDGRFDLLCIDASIPGPGSAEVIARFRETNPGRPVLLCAGNVTDPRVTTLIETGAIPVLAKPFTATELLGLVGDLLERSRAPTPAAGA